MLNGAQLLPLIFGYLAPTVMLLSISAGVLAKPETPSKPGIIDPFTKQLTDIKAFNLTAKRHKQHDFIIGGTAVATGSFRNVIALVDEHNNAFCTATLITPDTLITAGHCVYFLNNPNLPHFTALRSWVKQQDSWTLKQNIDTYLQLVSKELSATLKLNVDGNMVPQAIKSIAVDPSWQQLNQQMAHYYLSDASVMPDRLQYSDRAIITLKQSIKGVALIPLLSDGELDAIRQHFAVANAPALDVIQVGFGLRQDPDQLKQTLPRIDVKKALKALAGDKYHVSLPLHGIWQGKDGLRAAIGRTGKAACYGDSGGPTFIQLANGQWRYFANLSSGLDGAQCGQSKADFWPAELTNLKYATDIVDVWH